MVTVLISDSVRARQPAQAVPRPDLSRAAQVVEAVVVDRTGSRSRTGSPAVTPAHRFLRAISIRCSPRVSLLMPPCPSTPSRGSSPGRRAHRRYARPRCWRASHARFGFSSRQATNAKTIVEGYDQDDAVLGELQ